MDTVAADDVIVAAVTYIKSALGEYSGYRDQHRKRQWRGADRGLNPKAATGHLAKGGESPLVRAPPCGGNQDGYEKDPNEPRRSRFAAAHD